MKRRLKRMGTAALSAVLSIALVVSFAACEQTAAYRINVPDAAVDAYLGLYEIPEYDVINGSGEIVTGYTVRAKSATDSDGEAVEFVGEGKSIQAEKTGVYEFLLTADSKDVEEAVLKVNFKKQPPTVNIADDALPDYYMQWVWYALPEFTFSGNADLSKSGVKVYHTDGTEKEEVTLTGVGFTAEYADGEYLIVIHAEDSEGVGQDYEYTVPAMQGASEVVPGKIVYFDESFAVNQLGVGTGVTVSYNTNSEYSYEDEAGSTKVTFIDHYFDGLHLWLKNLYESDMSEYGSLTYRLYNPNDFNIYAGYRYFGDTLCLPRQWTEVTVSTSQLASKLDIANLVMRFGKEGETGAFNGNLPDGTTVYLSAMYASETEIIVPPADVVDGKVAYFDKEYGYKHVTAKTGVTLSYDETVAFKGEDGALKITLGTGNDPQNIGTIVLSTPQISDVSDWNYLVFNVYNPNDFDVQAAYWWVGDTRILAKSWTQVAITKADIAAINGVSSTNIAGAVIRIGQYAPGAPENWQPLADGTIVYLSAMYAVDELPAPDETKTDWGGVAVREALESFQGETNVSKFTGTGAGWWDNRTNLNNDTLYTANTSVYSYLAFKLYIDDGFTGSFTFNDGNGDKTLTVGELSAVDGIVFLDSDSNACAFAAGEWITVVVDLDATAKAGSNIFFAPNAAGVWYTAGTTVYSAAGFESAFGDVFAA